jgi:hypothetical protein
MIIWPVVMPIQANYQIVTGGCCHNFFMASKQSATPGKRDGLYVI